MNKITGTDRLFSSDLANVSRSNATIAFDTTVRIFTALIVNKEVIFDYHGVEDLMDLSLDLSETLIRKYNEKG